MSKRTHTKAYAEFEYVMERSLHLVSLHRTLDARLPKGIDLSDLLRAAIVLGVAAMDAYFTNVFAEKLAPYLKTHRPGPSMIGLLTKAGLDIAIALELLEMDRPYRRIRHLIERHFERITAQRLDAIDELFVAYGMQNFCKNAEGIAKRKTLLARIRAAAKRRNAIVHDGDLNAHGRLKHLDAKRCRSSVQEIVKFVSASDELIVRTLP